MMKRKRSYGEVLGENFPVVKRWWGIPEKLCFRIAGMSSDKWNEDLVTIERETFEPMNDDDGSVYIVRDGIKKLVKAPNVESYSIKEGVVEVSEVAFKECTKLMSLSVPYTLSEYYLDEAMENMPNKDRVVVTLWDWPHDCRIGNEMVRDIDEGWTDEQGFTYSKDRKRLLRAAPKVEEYWIPEGVERIERLAFNGCRFGTLHVPYTCRLDLLPEEEYPIFGSERVAGCVIEWDRPYAEQDLVDDVLCVADDDMVVDEYGVAYTKNMKRLLTVRLTCNGDESNIVKMKEYTVPDGVVTICDSAFGICKEFLTLSIPSSVRVIGQPLFGEAGGRIIIRVAGN